MPKGRKKLTLVISERMDTNRKRDRNENSLIRMSKSARDFMGYENKVEIYPNTKSTERRIGGALLLDIHQAFSSDLKKIKETIEDTNDLLSIGFVTTLTFNKVVGNKNGIKDIWITDDITDTVIGADPEFLLFENDKIIRANNVMGYHGIIGCDGAMAEIRPKPHMTPDGLVKNILSIFKDKELTNPIKNYRWTAGCYHKDEVRDYPIGGHIHIGNPAKIAQLDNFNRQNFFVGFNKILDELLAIPMIKIDGGSLGKARRTQCHMGKYGYFGEFRMCNGRLEHRTLSGMWLMHPKLTVAVFGTAKAIIDEVFNYVACNNYDIKYLFSEIIQQEHVWKSGFDKWLKIPLVKDLQCGMSSSEMISLLDNSAAEKINTTFLKKWYSKMKGLSTYKKYSKYIDLLYEILKMDQSKFKNCSKILQENWLGNKKFLST